MKLQLLRCLWDGAICIKACPSSCYKKRSLGIENSNFPFRSFSPTKESSLSWKCLNKKVLRKSEKIQREWPMSLVQWLIKGRRKLKILNHHARHRRRSSKLHFIRQIYNIVSSKQSVLFSSALCTSHSLLHNEYTSYKHCFYSEFSQLCTLWRIVQSSFSYGFLEEFEHMLSRCILTLSIDQFSQKRFGLTKKEA